MIGAAAPRLASPIGFPHWMTSRYIIRSQDGGGGGGGDGGAVRGENLISLSFQLDTLVSVHQSGGSLPGCPPGAADSADTCFLLFVVREVKYLLPFSYITITRVS